MRIEQLIEAPLPGDWDQDIYTERTSFRAKIEYARERATRIGGGSSRVAFEIDYEGRPTILKIAKNKKGLAQNEEESRIMSYWDVRQMGVVIPIIDYDEKNGHQPVWIHTEKAEKMTKAKFKQFFGGFSADEVARYIQHRLIELGRGNRYTRNLYVPDEAIEYLEDKEIIQDLIELVDGSDLLPGDLGIESNWGIYRGDPVLVDIGATVDVYMLHYDRDIKKARR